MKSNEMKTKRFLIASLLALSGLLSASWSDGAFDCARMPNPAECLANQERRRKQDEEIRMRKTPHQARQAIERTIEGFTLGMSSSDAIRLLTSGIQKGQFKVVRIETGPLRGEGELPLISDFENSIAIVTGPAKQSTLFSTEAASGIQLFFYESKLFWVGMHPYGNLLKALTEKYGLPFDSREPWCGVGGTRAWTDNRTTIHYCEYGGGYFTYTRLGGGHWETIPLNFNYLDNQVVSKMVNYDTQIRQKQEEETRRKLQTLPKTY